jgi:hypothetical protein
MLDRFILNTLLDSDATHVATIHRTFRDGRATATVTQVRAEHLTGHTIAWHTDDSLFTYITDGILWATPSGIGDEWMILPVGCPAARQMDAILIGVEAVA